MKRYRFIGYQTGLLPIPGLPLDATEDAFLEAAATYAAQFQVPVDPEDESKGDRPMTAAEVAASRLYEAYDDTTSAPLPDPAAVAAAAAAAAEAEAAASAKTDGTPPAAAQ